MVAGSGVVQIYNTFASEKAELPRVQHKDIGSGEWMVQSVSSAAGAILPYVLAGKVVGTGMKALGAELRLGATVGRALASDRAALVLGAGTYDFIKAPNANETRMGNALGTMTAFTAFELGNSKFGLNKSLPLMTRSAKDFSAQVLGRSVVGAGGAVAGLEVSHLYSTGKLADTRDVYNTMATGAFLNTALPAVQHGVGRAIEGVKQNSFLRRQEQQIARPLEIKEPFSFSAEQKANLRSASDFAHELTAKFPQVDANGNLNYYLAGSLATMLLIEGGGKMTPPKGSSSPVFESGSPVAISEAGMAHLSNFVRKIGDLDYVPLEGYKTQEGRMGKGGGILYEDLSPSARAIFKESPNGNAVMNDPVSLVGEPRPVSVEVNGKTFYIANPVDALAYKLIHAAESSGANQTKIATMNNDFGALLKTLETAYPREQLVQTVYETMNAYNKTSPNGLHMREGNSPFSPELQSFFKEVISSDPSAPHLNRLQYGHERSVGILRILGRMKSDESKTQLVDFINENRSSIDLTQPTLSHSNRMIVAAEVLKNPKQLELLNGKIKGEVTQESVAEALNVHTGTFREVAKTLPEGALEHQPVSSYMLNVLMEVREGSLAKDLRTIDMLTQKGVDPFSLIDIFKAEYAKGENHGNVMADLQTAASAIPADKLGNFVYKYKEAISERSELDFAANKYRTITEDQRPSRIQRVKEAFGLP